MSSCLHVRVYENHPLSHHQCNSFEQSLFVHLFGFHILNSDPWNALVLLCCLIFSKSGCVGNQGIAEELGVQTLGCWCWLSCWSLTAAPSQSVWASQPGSWTSLFCVFNTQSSKWALENTLKICMNKIKSLKFMLQVFRWTWLLVCFQKGYSAFFTLTKTKGLSLPVTKRR